MKKILFVCTHNSGRSQMAEAFFNKIAKGRALAISAGTRPSVHIDRGVAEAMLEIGIDIREQRPKLLTVEMLDNADKVITMGCSVEKACPASLVPTEDWELEDPEGESLYKVRQIRDKVRVKVLALVKEFL